MSRTLASLVTAAFATAAPLSAQGNGHMSGRVPPGHLPPAGMCRVWIDGLPPGRQPAATSCARAERDRYSYGRNARVVYGDRSARRVDWDGAKDRRKVSERRYVDASGRVCTEKTHYKKNGDRRSIVECKASDRVRGVTARCDGRDGDKRCRDVLDGDDVWDSRVPSSYPATLPDMIGAVIFNRGVHNDDVARWLGDGRYRVGYSDVDANGRPEQASWFDGAGRLVQQWIDGDRDGRADTVRLYERGQLVRVIGDR
jgi:hypothetical protein